MRLEQREKELAAIGASLGANCRPCIAVARAQVSVMRRPSCSRPGLTLLGRVGSVPEPGPVADKSRVHELAEVEAVLKMAEYVLKDEVEMARA